MHGRGATRFLPWLIVLLAAASLAVPTVAAQGDPADPNSEAACLAEYGEQTGEPLYLELLCRGAALLHIRGVFGGASEWVFLTYLALTAFAVVTWVFVLLWRVVPRRVLRLTDEGTIAEVDAGEPATYHMVLENRRKRRPVEVELSVTRPPKGWSASLAVEKELPSGFRELVGEHDALRFLLSARAVGANKATVQVNVQPPADAVPDQWSELDVTAIPYYKEEPKVRKAKEARIVTLIKEPETRVAIRDVTHDPARFLPSDEVRTTVVVGNTGTVDSAPVTVLLEVNGAELGESEVEVPAGSEEAVTFHWLAPETEARVRIRLAQGPTGA